MLNNINNTNNTAFGAKLRITTPVKDNVRLQNIQKTFAEQTQKITDTLSMTRLGEDWNNMECYYLGSSPEKSAGGFLKNSFDTMLETMSDNEIVNKMVKVLQAMKALNKREGALIGFDSSKYTANHEQNRNLLIAKDCREKGNETMAKRFEFLANCFSRKLQNIAEQEKKINDNFIEKLKFIADGDEEIMNFKNYM